MTKPSKRIRFRAAGLVLVVVGLAGVTEMWSGWGTGVLLNQMVRAGTGVPEAVVETGSIRGSRLTSLKVSSLRVRLGRWGQVVSVDSLELRYRLIPLLRRSLAVDLVRLVGTRLDLRDCTTGWFREREATPPDSVEAAWSVTLRRLSVADGAVVGGACADSTTWGVSGFQAEVFDVGTEPGFAGRVAEATLQIRPSGTQDDYSAKLSMAGAVRGGVVTIDSLRLLSPESDVSARGVLRALTAPPGTQDISFTVRADPLALRDLEPFSPFLNRETSARLEANLTSASDVLVITGAFDVLGGGGATVEVSLSEADGDHLHYGGRVVMHALEAASLISNAPPGSTAGVVDFDIEGPTLDRLSGTLGVSASTVDADSISLGEIQFDAALVDGRADISGIVEVDGGGASVGGWARPFADERGGELRGDFDWSRRGSEGTSVALAGEYELGFSFTDIRSASGSAEVRLSDSSIGAASVPNASLEVDLEMGSGAWSAEASIGVGRVDARGAIDLADDPRFLIEVADFRNLDVAGLSATEASSDVNGSLAGERTGGAAGLGDWTARLELARSSLGPLVADTTTIDIVLQDRRLGVDVLASLLGGSVEARVDGDITGTPRLSLTRGVFTDIDLAAGAGDGEAVSSLTGTVTGRWSPESPLGSNLVVSLDESRLRRLHLDSATVDVTMKGDAVDLVARMMPPEGELRVRASRLDTGEAPAWQLDEAAMRTFDLAALLPDGEAESSVTGVLRARWRGDTLEGTAGEARLELDRSAVGRWVVEGATVDAALADGRSTIVGTVDAEAFAGGLDASVDLYGPSAGRGTARFSGRVGEVTIDSSYAVARYDSLSFDVDTLLLWSPALVAEGRAQLLRTPTRLRDFAVTAALYDAQPLRSWFGVVVDSLMRADLHATGSAVGDSVEVVAELSGVGLSTPAAHVSELSGSGHGFLASDGRMNSVSATAEANAIQLGRLTVRRAEIDVSPEGDGLELSARAFVDDDREVSGIVSTRPIDGGVDVLVKALRVDLPGQAWDLEGSPSVRLDGGIDVRDFALVSATGAGRILVGGVMGESGEQNLHMSVSGLRLAGLSDVIGYDGLQGTVAGELDVTGTGVAPTVVGTLDARGALGDMGPAVLNARVEYEDRALTLDAALGVAGVPAARLFGQLPVRLTFAGEDSTESSGALLTGEPMDLDVSVQRLGLRWLAPWVPSESVSLIAGELNMDLHAGGTPAVPALSGGFSVADAAAALPLLGLQLRDGGLEGRFETDRLVIDHAEVGSGAGRMVSSGEIRSDGGGGSAAIALEVSLDDFLAIRTDVFRAVVDGTLSVGGTTIAPTVSGTLDLLSGDVFLGGRFAGTQAEVVELTEEDYATLAARFGYERPTSSPLSRTAGAGALALDVQVGMGRDTWVRQRANPALSVQFSGDVRVEKASNELESVYGRLEAVPRGSYVEQFGRRFAITRGSVDFNGPLPELRLDVEGEYAVPARGDPTASEVVIGLGVLGTLDDLGLVLSSRPEMENADIVSYMATGRPASQSMQFGSSGSGQLIERGTTMALGRATTAVERVASESIGLDVMQIRTDGSRGVTVVAGRYVSPRLYLGFKQPIGFRRSDSSSGTRTRSPEVEIEYQALRWLLLNLQREGSRIDFFFRSRYAY